LCFIAIGGIIIALAIPGGKSMSFRTRFPHSSYFLLLMAAALSAFGSGDQQPEAGGTDASDPGVSAPLTDHAGFRPLFDGVSLSGWHGYDGADASQRWNVEQGALRIDAESEARVDLVSDGEFENFELVLEWNISPAGNSGIMFNVVDSLEYDKPWKTGPELQILDNFGHEDSAATHRAGDLYDLVSASEEVSRAAGQWNETRIVVHDGRLRHWLNGTLIIDIQMWDEDWRELVAGSKFANMPGFGNYRRGHIVLQDHDDVVAFRNIRIQEQ
jgi:hypothetical protein